MRHLVNHRLYFLATLLFMLCVCGNAMALTVKDVRIGMHPDKTRLVVELDEMSKFKTFVLDDPWRIIVDMPTFNWQAGAISKPKSSAVSGIRQGELKPGISRMVIDLKRPVSLKNAFLLRKNGGKPDRLVIDFTNSDASTFQREKDKSFGILDTGNPSVQKSSAVPIPPPPPVKSSTAPVKTTTTTSGMAIPARKPVTTGASASSQQPYTPPPVAQQQTKPLIVLDPGHGGVDPGAIGANGIFEKHITLSMAKELKQMLEATGRYDVVLTREKDQYKRLYQRVDFARQRNADLFISLHADSIGKSSVRGASIYTLSEKASDSQTARLAERENKADIIAGTDLSHEDEQVANILIDIAMRDTMNQSKFFANTVVTSLNGDGLKVLEKPHRYAGFAVLKAPDIPSVLIEIGFMSNKTEAQQLSRPDHRQKIGRALIKGIDAYFEKVRRNNRT